MPLEAQAQQDFRATDANIVPRDIETCLEQDQRDDLSRNIYGVLGVPLDAIELEALLERIDLAVADRGPFLLSTPNVNFMMMAREDEEFRESLLASDLCPADGMPLVWISRLLGVPIQSRLSGSDIFDALRTRRDRDRKLKVFLFGGADGLAGSVGGSINAESGGLVCVGAHNPGFGSVAEMSTSSTIDQVNLAGADLLTVFLSAKKAQGWLLQNHHRIEVPFRAQFGATINVQAGVVKRAPRLVQRMGFEWLWRVKEEPYLWRRYWGDGRRLLYVLVSQVLPLSIERIWRSLAGLDKRESLTLDQSTDGEVATIKLSGAATAHYIDAASKCFRRVLRARKTIVIDLSQISTIDPRFFGLLLMLRKQLIEQGNRLEFSGFTRRSVRMFRLNGFSFLLEPR